MDLCRARCVQPSFLDGTHFSCYLLPAGRFLRRVFCLTVLATGCGAADAAAQGVEAWGIEQLMAELSQVGRAQAQFIERKYMKVLKTPLESSGTLTYEAPDRMIKHTVKPKPETMTVEGERLTLERQGRTRTLRLEDYPLLWAFIESIRATLKGDLAALRRFYDVELSGGPQRWSLALKPRDAKMSRVITSVEISGVQGKIRTVKVQEAQGDRSVMTITEEN
jgi:outer membrane lipoprotein-sorting protein